MVTAAGNFQSQTFDKNVLILKKIVMALLALIRLNKIHWREMNSLWSSTKLSYTDTKNEYEHTPH